MLTDNERAAAAGAAMRWPEGDSSVFLMNPKGCSPDGGEVERAALVLEGDPKRAFTEG